MQPTSNSTIEYVHYAVPTDRKLSNRFNGVINIASDQLWQ